MTKTLREQSNYVFFVVSVATMVCHDGSADVLRHNDMLEHVDGVLRHKLVCGRWMSYDSRVVRTLSGGMRGHFGWKKVYTRSFQCGD